MRFKRYRVSVKKVPKSQARRGLLRRKTVQVRIRRETYQRNGHK